MRVIAIDPGETTGIAVYCDLFTDPMWYQAVEGQMPALSALRHELAFEVHVMVIEEFRISAGTARKSRSGSNIAIEIIGAAKWLAHCAGVPVVMQTPSDVMGFIGKRFEKLKRIGWYTPGSEHANDAASHLLYYLIKNGHIDVSRVLAAEDK